MSFKWEMLDHGQWISNQLRFATQAEAEAYGRDLGWRWLGMPEPARAAPADEPVNSAWDNGLKNLVS